MNNRLDGMMRRYEMTRTIPSDKNEMINSQYGRISYWNWIHCEMKRINDDGGSASIYQLGNICALI